MATRRAVNRDIRSFAFVWSGVTIIIGVATFFAIYLTYGNTTSAANRDGVALPVLATQGAPATAAVAVAATAVPTVTSESEPTTVAQAVVEEPEVEEQPEVESQPDVESQESVEAMTEPEAEMETEAEEPMVAQAEEDGMEEDGMEEEAMSEDTNMETADTEETASDDADAEEAMVEENPAVESAELSQPEQEQTEPEIEPTALPVNVDEFEVGIQVQSSTDYNPDTQNAWMNDVQGLNLDWFKMQMRWEQVEPAQDEYDWSKLDLALPIAAERDLKVALSFLAAPDWAREPGANLDFEGPPADLGEMEEMLRLTLERYPGMIHAIEVWNEPNLDREWMSPNGLSAPGVVEMLRVAYTTIKDIDPGIIVISGALAPTGGFVDPVTGVVGAIDDFDFMDQLIDAGLLNYADCIGAHHNGYNIGPSLSWENVPNDPDAVFRGPFDNPHHSWSFQSTLQGYANKIAVAGGDQKLCVTEFGWPSVDDLDGVPEGFRFALDNTLEEQAEYFIEALNNMEEWGFVRLAFIWNLNYGPQIGWDASNDNVPYSLIGPEFSRRPAYNAIAEWAAARQE